MSKLASDVMKAWFQRVWTDGDESAIDEMFPAHGEAHGLADDSVLQGPNGFRPFWEGIRSVYHPIRIDVIDCVDDGDRCYTRCRGTFGFGGREVVLEGGCVSEVDRENGHVLRSENCWDFLGLMQSMGALPADAFTQACGGETFVAAVGTSDTPA